MTWGDLPAARFFFFSLDRRIPRQLRATSDLAILESSKTTIVDFRVENPIKMDGLPVVPHKAVAEVSKIGNL